MDYIRPGESNTHVISCEKCMAIIVFSEDDLFLAKELDRVAFLKGDIQNVSRIYTKCPCCGSNQDVAAGFRYVSGDKRWLRF